VALGVDDAVTCTPASFIGLAWINAAFLWVFWMGFWALALLRKINVDDIENNDEVA